MDYTIEGLRTVIEQYDGIASLEQLQKAGFSRMMIYAGLKDGVLNKEAHGNYSIADQQPDEYRIIQCRSDKVVFSHATALFLHGLSDRVPHTLDITVPQGDNVSKIKRDYSNTRFHYCKKDLWQLGLTKIVTPQGFTVNAYDLERCICDLIRDKKNVDTQIYIQAIREYFMHHCKNRKIIKYSREMNIEDKVRTYMEVLQAV
ncbi:type IV toxin-antitoxin system AbiEi family antitoxin domain-containing protein [Blautia sp. HCP3S3_G3]|uniref:type IV toxin-antitoxin system AbiEi family antitoxin domain-containing protein n=1 Tax=Blautia sp. HCP3S3_G3 TaxID=3438913 RepID=UPI003F8A3F1D